MKTKRYVLVVGLIGVAILIGVIVGRLFSSPEKKVQHRIDHLYGIVEPQFKREMGTLLGPAILLGNRITALQNGDEIFPAMLETIAHAQRSINFETYIYWSGTIGAQFANALIERSRAGVKVSLLLDALGSAKMDATLISKMQSAGIQIERYHPIHWYSLGRLNNRTHRKLLVADGLTAFTGGVGIADQWAGHSQDADHWRDMHFRVEGPAVAQLQAAFLDNWVKTTGAVLHGESYFPALAERGEHQMHLFTSSPTSGSASMRLMYLAAITAAEISIDIDAAYFVPDELMLTELLRARARGARIRILLPGKHIDSETIRVASKRVWGRLLESGIEIYEFQPTMLHSKMLIFDRAMVSVGSTNFDMRSFELNDEASLNVYDSKFAIDMTSVFEKDLQRSVRYTLAQWRNRPWTEKLAELVLIPIQSQL